jgi:hypothetical protein
MNRYCIARSGQNLAGGGIKWRVYDDVAKCFAEPMDKESGKADARKRANLMNVNKVTQ